MKNKLTFFKIILLGIFFKVAVEKMFKIEVLAIVKVMYLCNIFPFF